MSTLRAISIFLLAPWLVIFASTGCVGSSDTGGSSLQFVNSFDGSASSADAVGDGNIEEHPSPDAIDDGESQGNGEPEDGADSLDQAPPTPCTEDSSTNDCDDDNPCTDDSCEDGICLNTPNSETCDDGDACTEGEICSEGSCGAGEALECDDDNICTDDACDPETGCTFEPNSAPCDDDDICTQSHICSEGECAGSNPLDCNDHNNCTADTCISETGCKNTLIVSNECRPNIHVDFPPRGASIEWSDLSVPDIQVTGTVVSGAGPITELTLNGESVAVGEEGGFSATFTPSVGGNTIELVATDSFDTTRNRVQSFHWAPTYFHPEDLSVVYPESDCEGITEGDNCYHAVQGDPLTWEKSEHECVTWGGHLADIQSEERNTWVRGFLDTVCTDKAAWIGLSDAGEEGVYLWPDGSALDYSNWGGDEPNDYGEGEDVVEITVDGQWNDVSVDEERSCYVCSRAYKAATYLYQGHADPGMGLYISQEVLDDGDHSPPADDLTTIFENIFASFDVGSLIPTPAAEGVSVTGLFNTKGTYDIYITNLIHDTPLLSMQSIDGGWALSAMILNTQAKLEAKKTSGGFLFPGSLPGTITIDSINIDAVLEITVGTAQNEGDGDSEGDGADQSHEINVTVVDTVVEINGVAVEIDHALASFIEGSIAGVMDDFVADIEEQFAAEMDDVLGPTLVDALGSLAFGFDFTLPSVNPDNPDVVVEVKTDFSSVDFTPDGGTFVMRTLALPTSIVAPYESLGAPARSGCGVTEQVMVAPKNAPMEIMMSDDMVNIILFSAWRGGFVEFDVPPEMLGDLDLESMGVKDLEATVSGMLAPAISDCGPDGTLLLHMGDLKVAASMKMLNMPLDFEVYASFEAPFKIGVEDGVISFGITEITSTKTEITIQQDKMLAFEPLLLSIMEENLVPLLLDGLGSDTLGGLPLPAIDLSGAVEGEVDAIVSIKPLSAMRIDGNNIIAAELDPNAPDPKPVE